MDRGQRCTLRPRHCLISFRIEPVPLPLAPSPALDCSGHRKESTSHVKIMNAARPLAVWHLASLDAPTVAVVWSLAFAWAGQIHLRLWVPLLLALATWSVYVCDRLLDARASLRSPARHVLRERHHFHWRHRHILLLLAAAAACTAAAIVLVLIPPMARERDSVLAAAALAYFSGVHSRRSPWPSALKFPRLFSGKEFLVGTLFTAGCVLPAWPLDHASGTEHSLLWTFWIPAVYFVALAWLNCSCIARWEAANAVNAAPREPSRGRISRLLQLQSARFCAAALLALAGGLLATIASGAHPRAAALLAAGALSALLLALLDSVRTRMTPLALRALADLVLLTPLLLAPLGRFLG